MVLVVDKIFKTYWILLHHVKYFIKVFFVEKNYLGNFLTLMKGN